MSKLLLVYATWTGATRGVAEAIAAELEAAGHAVTLATAASVKDVAPYDAVILGTGVHAGKLPRPTLAFMRRFAGPLAAKPVAWFLVCLTMIVDNEETRAKALGFLEPLRAAAPSVEPLEIGLFAGAVLTDTEEFRTLNPLLKIPAGSMGKTIPDHRDWDAIRGWARTLSAKLAPVAA